MIQSLNNKLSKYTLLIVDDNTTNRLVLKHLLKELDSPKVEAANGEEALTTLAALNGQPILMFLDLDMPVLNGYEVIEALEANAAKYATIKTIIVTATFLSSSQKEMLKKTVIGYIQKPVDKGALMQLISDSIH
jgi:CheY-like chemotaxis protein